MLLSTDVQALPGCTVKQVLRKSFSCFEEVAGSLTSMAMQDNCRLVIASQCNFATVSFLFFVDN